MVKILIKEMSFHEPWWAECWSAIAAITWCITVISMGGMTEIAGFEMQLAIAPEWVWYILSFGAAIGHLYSLSRSKRILRYWLCFFMAWWWGFVGLAISFQGIVRPSIIFYIIFSAININSLLVLYPRRE